MAAKPRPKLQRSSGHGVSAIEELARLPLHYHPTSLTPTVIHGMLAANSLRRTEFSDPQPIFFYGINNAEPIVVGPYAEAINTVFYSFGRAQRYVLLDDPVNMSAILDLSSVPFITTVGSVESQTDKTIARIAQTANLEDDEEQPPLSAVIDQASGLIREASGLMRTSMPEGVVSTFYGEINVTWRKGDDIIRIACFPSRPSILQFGNLSQPLGSYQSQPSPSAQDLAARLDTLNGEVVP